MSTGSLLYLKIAHGSGSLFRSCSEFLHYGPSPLHLDISRRASSGVMERLEKIVLCHTETLKILEFNQS